MCIPTLSLEIALILLRDRQFSETFLNIKTVKMTDLKNIMEISFPDDGVSVCDCAYCVFFPFIFIFIFIFSGCESTVRL